MHSRLSAVAIGVSMVLSVAACATGARQQPPERGTITVGVTTSGPDAASLTFRVTIEPVGISGTVKAEAGVFTKSAVPLGNHVVRLLDVPARCRIESGGERTITISSSRRNAVVRFDVQCAAG